MNPICRECVLNKKLYNAPEDASPEQIRAYQEAVYKTVDTDTTEDTGTDASYRIDRIWASMFGPLKDYTQIKIYFNNLMMQYVPMLMERLATAEDPLRLALCYSMTGNFIDFAAMSNVDEDHLKSLLEDADRIETDPEMLAAFRSEIQKAERIAFVTDNCGEIVMDQVLMRAIKMVNPEAEICAIVRGKPVVNDATMEDACQIGLPEEVKVIGNGSDFPGMYINKASDESVSVLRAADVIIAKGQANFETLAGCGLNVFYVFMCKCGLFTERFSVPKFTPLIVRENTAASLK